MANQCNQGQEYFIINPGMGDQFTYPWGHFTVLSVCGQWCHGWDWHTTVRRIYVI